MTPIKNNFDIDLDFGNRDQALTHLQHYKASISKDGEKFTKHATGVYFTEIPHDVNRQATIDYKAAEERNYFKVDFLNVSVYEQVKSEQHLTELMVTEPPWSRLLEKDFCEQLIHIGNYHSMICKLPEPIDSIPRMAMFLAAIRPGKKHLIGQSWKDVAKTIWDKVEGEYTFKRSHSVSYAHLVVVHMNLINGSV
jgi:hypothetical protein